MKMTRRSKKAKFLSTLVFYDEPQLVVLSRSEGFKIIATAIDDDSRVYPFFAAEIDNDQWERYLRGFSDLNYLFRFPKGKKWFTFDLANAQDGIVPLQEAARDDFADKDYIPAHGFFSRDHTEPFESREVQQSTQTFAIDGSWDLPDFSHFYGKFSDLYAFFLSVEKFKSPSGRTDLKRRIKQAFTGYPMRGGSSYVHFYDDLYSIQEWIDRLSVKRIQYASPGHVAVTARNDIFRDFVIAIGNYEQNQIAVSEKYRQLHKFLSKSHLLTADAKDEERLKPYSDYILQLTNELAEASALSDFDTILELTEKNSLATAKIVLSHIRRLERAFVFFAEGRVRFSDSQGQADSPPTADLGVFA
jgi:hypothetical protein